MAETEFNNNLAAPSLQDFRRQGAVYDGLVQTLQEGTFVHAYLISGIEGVGKRSLCGAVTQYLMCTGGQPPCGECPGCVQVREGSHPDVITVRCGIPIHPEVEKGLKTIPVKEIRMVNDLVARHTFAGGRRVVVIHEAENMTQQAQNALLKTLEEPLPGTVFLLTSAAPALLLPTIISRCRALKLHPWPDETVMQVLLRHGVDKPRALEAVHTCGGSIGRALSVAADEGYWQRRSAVLKDFFGLESRSDVLRISGQYKDQREHSAQILDDVEDMIRTLLLVRLGQRDAALISAWPEPWRRMAGKADVAAFSSLMDAVADARRLRGNQVTWQAVVEKLLLRLMEEKNRW